MNTAILTIGDELLIGQVVDTNSAFIAEKLNEAGLRVSRILSISDTHNEIIEALDAVNKIAHLVLVTGGLGPTKDDITKAAICEYFGTRLVLHEESLTNIKNLFRSRNFSINKLNRKQAEVPESCKVIINPEGTASGMWFEKDGTVFVFMPGVPFEMKAMLVNRIIPELITRFKPVPLYQKTVLTQGTYEGMLAETLDDWETDLEKMNVKVAYLPSPGTIRIRLTTDKEDGKNKIDAAIEKLNSIIPGKIFGFNNDTLQEVVAALLIERGHTVSTAESCTGGNVSHLLTLVPGSSAYFNGSVIAYSNEIKEKVLGVQLSTLMKYGAVSREVVEEMAAGVKRLMKTDYSIALSGIAGPDGGTEEKPVGTVWIAVASGAEVKSKMFLFGEDRGRNITKASLTALNMLRKMIAECNA